MLARRSTRNLDDSLPHCLAWLLKFLRLAVSCSLMLEASSGFAEEPELSNLATYAPGFEQELNSMQREFLDTSTRARRFVNGRSVVRTQDAFHGLLNSAPSTDRLDQIVRSEVPPIPAQYFVCREDWVFGPLFHERGQLNLAPVGDVWQLRDSATVVHAASHVVSAWKRILRYLDTGVSIPSPFLRDFMDAVKKLDSSCEDIITERRLCGVHRARGQLRLLRSITPAKLRDPRFLAQLRWRVRPDSFDGGNVADLVQFMKNRSLAPLPGSDVGRVSGQLVATVEHALAQQLGLEGPPLEEYKPLLPNGYREENLVEARFHR